MIRAVKPDIETGKEGEKTMTDLLDKYQEFFDDAYKEGALNARTKILISLGTALGAGCEP
ncbi:hypothetical protein MNBD_NITROSPINAE04-2438 [hydrothermal vent metagenome]|uniref:Carboxymuconolactone decarboxylase-like domain-containing protein n=1 Tax=hydrothermal vent metagenome TaxID=652676 RepID=A0A3B1BP44_9ZZZZ